MKAADAARHAANLFHCIRLTFVDIETLWATF
jgi:hypothetical protein